MPTVAIILAVLLASQAQPASDRYGIGGDAAPGGEAPASATPPTNTASGNTGTPSPPPAGSADPNGGLIPKISSPPASGQSAAAAPSGNTATGNAGNAFAPQQTSPPSDVSPPPYDAEAPYRSSTPPSKAPPAAASSRTTSAPPAAKPKPTSIMRQMLAPPPASQLTGSPVTLSEVIAGAPSRDDQSQRIEAYWDLCSSVADYYLGVLEQGEMQTLRSKIPGAGAVMQQAESKFAVRLGTARQAAVASQLRLANVMGRPGLLPLPADLPHCGSYQTRYEEIFGNRPSGEAKELATLLPMRYSELKEYALAVVQTRAALDTVASNDRGDGVATIRALELLALQRRAFVQIARDYNRRIARYAELSMPGEIGAERLIGLLIRRDNTPTATRPASPSRTNGRQSNNTTSPPLRTFVNDEGWEPASQNVSRTAVRDDAVKPAAAEENRSGPREERSLLVSPPEQGVQ